jgi:hypothetical protein
MRNESFNRCLVGDQSIDVDEYCTFTYDKNSHRDINHERSQHDSFGKKGRFNIKLPNPDINCKFDTPMHRNLPVLTCRQI